MNYTIKKLLYIIFLIISIYNVNLFAKKQVVKIAYLPITHALPLFVQYDLAGGDFKDYKLELVKFGSWPELMDALNTGRVDGASVLIELAIKSREMGFDLRAVALGHRDGNVVIVDNKIKNVSDLKSKSFAIPHKLSTHNILLNKMLKAAGLAYTDVNIVELPPPEMPVSLVEKRIAGYCVAEPFGAKSVVMGTGKVLFESVDIWKNSICCALVLNGNFIKKSKTTAKSFVSDYLKAGELIEKNKEKAGVIAAKYLKVDKNVLEQSLKWISYNNLTISENDFNELISNMKELNMVKIAPNYVSFVGF